MSRHRISIGLVLLQTSACLADGLKHVNFAELHVLLILLLISPPLLGVVLVRLLTKQRGNWKKILGAGLVGIAVEVLMTVFLFFSSDTIHLFTPFILGGLSGGVVSSLLFRRLTKGAPQEIGAE